MLTHDHFEQLSAAAVTCHITRSELVDLRAHMETCAECRDFVGDIREVIGPAILECAEARFPVKLPKGAEERFIAKAHSEGIPLGKKQPSQRGRSKHQWGIALAAVAALIALLGILVYTKHLADERRLPRRTTEVIQPPTIPFENNEAEDLRRERSKLKEQVQSLQSQAEAAAARLAFYQDALKVSDIRRAEVGSRLNDLETTNRGLHKTLDDRDAQLAQLSGNVERLTSLKDANEIAVQTEESELRNLRDSVEKLKTDIQTAQAQAAASKDAKELVVARNLHIVDVHDANEVGNQQKAFGRIFYTEGKSLVFFAYDLDDPNKLNTKINFYVWGEKLGAAQPVKSLGIFHSDDKNEGRWVLTFDDPHVLARINSVFVTVESSKKMVTEPRGKKILAAFLGAKANHP